MSAVNLTVYKNLNMGAVRCYMICQKKTKIFENCHIGFLKILKGGNTDIASSRQVQAPLWGIRHQVRHSLKLK